MVWLFWRVNTKSTNKTSPSIPKCVIDLTLGPSTITGRVETIVGGQQGHESHVCFNQRTDDADTLYVNNTNAMSVNLANKRKVMMTNCDTLKRSFFTYMYVGL